MQFSVLQDWNEEWVTSYLNDRGEGTREKKAEEQLFSTFVLSFHVIQQLLCFCLIMLPHFIQLCSWFFQQKRKGFGFCGYGCYDITLQVADMIHSFFTNTQTRYLHQEVLEELVWCRFCSPFMAFSNTGCSFNHWFAFTVHHDLNCFGWFCAINRGFSKGNNC